MKASIFTQIYLLHVLELVCHMLPELCKRFTGQLCHVRNGKRNRECLSRKRKNFSKYERSSNISCEKEEQFILCNSWGVLEPVHINYRKTNINSMEWLTYEEICMLTPSSKNCGSHKRCFFYPYLIEINLITTYWLTWRTFNFKHHHYTIYIIYSIEEYSFMQTFFST